MVEDVPKGDKVVDGYQDANKPSCSPRTITQRTTRTSLVDHGSVLLHLVSLPDGCSMHSKGDKNQVDLLLRASKETPEVDRHLGNLKTPTEKVTITLG